MEKVQLVKMVANLKLEVGFFIEIMANGMATNISISLHASFSIVQKLKINLSNTEISTHDNFIVKH